MTTPDKPMTEPRAADRPQWSGIIPRSLFDRFEAEPVAGAALCGLGDALLGTADGRLLEFVALRSAAARDCLYMWRGHCLIALRRPQGRLTEDEIARVAAGPEALSGRDAAILRGIDELLHDRCLSPATRSAVGGEELILTIATLFYEAIATIMRDAEPDERALPGLETPATAALTVGRWRR
jgi:alkylhydroperoxidase family enzyme